jgi:D-amino-acid oxidase
MKKKHFLILGAGVSGLSTGILLLKKGYSVTIWAKDLPPYTTSNKAAAVWYPFSCGSPHQANGWLRATLTYFQKEILSEKSSGCKKTTVVEIFDHKTADPWWKNSTDSYQKIDKKYLPKEYVDGYQIDGLVMDTDVYMDYLVGTFKKLGGKMQQKAITTITEAFEKYNMVINCTGLGSRTLFNDPKVYACRGQILKIKPNDLDYSLFEEEGPNSLAYVIPRLKDVILGGTVQDNDWNLHPDEKDTQDILRKYTNLFPQLKTPEILEIKVGLRPSRKEIRLEIEKYSDNFVIHNYGHGGSGFNLSWGCAQNVVDLVDSII